ncbi:MAG: hypothetical protein Fur0043_01670 [Anaerolineales bacterium]
MTLLLSPPSLDDLIRLLKAWRFWALGALIGALLGAAAYALFPPPYRARATVNVDFNLEEAWPQETDRQQFYYLERETRKLEEIAWSDEVLQMVAREHGVSVADLRHGILSLSQPAEAGWHFYAESRDPARASALASAWALAFTAQVQAQVTAQSGLNSFIRVQAVQTQDIPVERRVGQGAYLLAGAIGTLVVGALLILFFGRPRP